MKDLFIDFEKKQTGIQLLQDPDLIRFLRKTTVQYLSTTPVYKDSKHSMMHLRKESFSFRFSHELIRTGHNQWHLMSPKTKEEGSLSSVSQSKLKLVVDKKSIQVLAVDDLVKIQKPTDSLPIHSLFQLAKEEAEFQGRHGVHVCEVVQAGDEIITVFENCGTSLDRLFPLGGQFDFGFRLNVAIRLCSELLFLQQHEVVHRDLKPAHICLKYLPKGSFKIIFIDFGLSKQAASAGNDELAVTYHDIALEPLSRQSSQACVRHALSAILGELFGAKDVLKFKKRQGEELPATYQASYCFEGLFEGYDCTDVDPFILRDVKQLLEALGSHRSEERPTVDQLNKFFSTIPQRLHAYKQYLLQVGQQQSTLLELDRLHQEITGFHREKIPNHALTKTLKAKEQRIADSLKQSGSTQSHDLLRKNLTKKNQRVDLTGRDCPYPNLDLSIQLIEAENKRLSQSLVHFKRFEKTMTVDEKWAYTNSTGVKQIIKLLKSSLPIVEKIKKLQAIGEQKTQDGILTWYNHSCFFGKGRHENVEKLYHQLSHLNVYNSQFCLLEDQLAEIEEFIKKNHFVHEKEVDRGQYQKA